MVKDNLTHIYVLRDPRDMKIRYVGKSNTPKKRYKQHLYHAQNNNNSRDEWIRELLQINKKPILEIIDIVKKTDWLEIETDYITQFKKSWYPLTNDTHQNIKLIDRKRLMELLND